MTGNQFIKKTGIDDETYFTIFDPKLFTTQGINIVMDYILGVPNAVIPILDWKDKGKTFYFVNGKLSDYAEVMRNKKAMMNKQTLLKWRESEIGMYINYKIPISEKIDRIQKVCDEFRNRWHELELEEEKYFSDFTKDFDYIKEYNVKIEIEPCQ